ncbi:MAG: ATP-binding protein [Planctomycetota bacterium]
MSNSLDVWEYKDCISSTVDAAADVIRILVEQLEKFQWSEKDSFAVHMATEEAILNAVKHGNEFDETKQVDVELRLTGDSFFARISDQGSGFDPSEVPDPCDDCNLEKTSGRGVSLIKNFVDQVKFNESGNTIEFSKKRIDLE